MAITENNDASSRNKQSYCCEGRAADGIVNGCEAMLSTTPLLVIWILLVVIFGAAFFFLIIGATPLGHPKREEYLNISIQGLNVMFTYAAISKFPKRSRMMIRLVRIKGEPDGTDYLGKTSADIFDYIPWWRRFHIITVLLLNCIFQFINQGFRIKYYNWQLVTFTPLAELWVNLFFVLSFVCAAWAPAYACRCLQWVRKTGRAPPGQEFDFFQTLVGKETYTWRELWAALKRESNASLQGFVGKDDYTFWDVCRAVWLRLLIVMKCKTKPEQEKDNDEETKQQHPRDTVRTVPEESERSMEQMELGGDPMRHRRQVDAEESNNVEMEEARDVDDDDDAKVHKHDE